MIKAMAGKREELGIYQAALAHLKAGVVDQTVVFHVHGVDARGRIVVCKTLRCGRFNLLCKSSALPCWYGSFERGALLSEGTFRPCITRS